MVLTFYLGSRHLINGFVSQMVLSALEEKLNVMMRSNVEFSGAME